MLDIMKWVNNMEYHNIFSVRRCTEAKGFELLQRHPQYFIWTSTVASCGRRKLYILGDFPEVSLCDILPVYVPSPPPIAARQKGLFFYEVSDGISV
jgi:hypothetical protein